MEDIKFDFYKNPSKSKDYQDSEYHIRINGRKVIDIKSLSEKIQKTCSLTKSDVNGVLIALQDEITYQLSLGNIVKLDNVCQFETILCTKGKCTGKETGRDIELKTIRIRPQKELKEEVRKELMEREIVRCRAKHSQQLSDEHIEKTVNTFFEENEFLTRKHLEDILCSTPYKTRQIIKKLCEKGILVNVGSALHPLYRAGIITDEAKRKE